MAVSLLKAQPTCTLHHGPQIPRIGLGTWQLQGTECEDAVRAALDMGYRHVDTAEAYGNEECVGRAMAPCDRSEIFVTSKVGRDHLRPRDLKAACRASLDRLDTDRIDLYLVHWPNADVPMEETVGALEELLDDGAIRAWGVSNFTVAHLEELLRHGQPSVNQVELHPRLRQAELDRFCREHGIRVTAYSPLAKGEVVDQDVLTEIGRRHSKSAGQVALRWSFQHGHIVIPRSSSPKHLRENAEILDFQLGADEMDRIDQLDRGERLVEPEFAEFDRAG